MVLICKLSLHAYAFKATDCVVSHRMLHNVQNACMQLELCVSLQIAPNKDADLLLLDANSLELRYVFANGVLVRTPEWTRGGMFERGDRIRPIKPDLESYIGKE